MSARARRLADPDTGEVVPAIPVNEGLIVVDPKNQKRNINHVKLRVARKQRRMINSLSIEERGFLFTLLNYLEWETNIVAGDGIIEEKGKPLSLVKIEKLMGISRHFRIKIVESLVQKKVIGFLMVKNKRAAIIVNPEYALKGRKPDDALKKAFDLELDVWEEDGEESDDDPD
jgi:hypothetical protein